MSSLKPDILHRYSGGPSPIRSEHGLDLTGEKDKNLQDELIMTNILNKDKIGRKETSFPDIWHSQ